ncbi:HNH endonuclease signature motif containing protein [Williamsia sp.]|uniref:HNH endonuclease signature motif containing protein n=1 Tax=Williamsia sp. TaxID=1872085 RepID=UPI002F95DB88
MDFGGMFARLSDLAGDAAVVAGDDAELSSRVVMVIRLNHVVEQILFRLVGELDGRGIATRRGGGSTAKLLQQAGMAPAVAHRYVRVGAALDDIALVASYAVDGSLSGEHVDAIVKGLGHIDRRNSDLSGEDRADCVRGLWAEALSASPAAVSVRARHMALVLSPPDKAIPDAENHELNEFTLGLGEDGRSHGTLDLDNLLGEKLRVALDPLSKPVPEPDGSADRRSSAQVRADALERLLDSYLEQEDRPTRGGATPQVVLTLTPEGLQTLQLSGIPGAKAPEVAAAFEWTGPASASTAQLVACDSVITKILVDNNMVPLDVGRDHRTVTPAIRKALIARDRGCSFPGCDCPPGRTDAHHIRHWSQGGATSLANTVLLCRRHHRYIHHMGWEVFIGSDGHPWFINPDDTTRTPLRSHARRTMTSDLAAA